MRRPPLNPVITNQAFRDLENRDYCLCEGVCVYVLVYLCQKKEKVKERERAHPCVCSFLCMIYVYPLFLFCLILSFFSSFLSLQSSSVFLSSHMFPLFYSHLFSISCPFYTFHCFLFLLRFVLLSSLSKIFSFSSPLHFPLHLIQSHLLLSLSILFLFLISFFFFLFLSFLLVSTFFSPSSPSFLCSLFFPFTPTCSASLLPLSCYFTVSPLHFHLFLTSSLSSFLLRLFSSPSCPSPFSPFLFPPLSQRVKNA